MKPDFVRMKVEAVGGGDISIAKEVTATITGPTMAVIDLVDQLIAFTSDSGGGVVAATAESLSGEVTDLLGEQKGRKH